MIQLDALKKRPERQTHTHTNPNWHVGPVLTSLALDKNPPGAKNQYIVNNIYLCAAVVPNYLGFNVAVEKLGQMTGNGTFMGATKDGLTPPVYVYLNKYVYNCKDT